jgi:hypothetical protein
VPPPAAPRPPPQEAPAAEARRPANGDPALFGQLVKLGQNLVLAEALAKNAAHAEALVDRLCDEHRRLQEHPPLDEGKARLRDAAEFMAPLVDYEAPLDDPPGKLHLADPLRIRLQGLGPDAMLKLTDQDLAGLDFAWLQQLAAFDHWSLLGAGRLKDHPIDDAYADPLPNYISLQQWVKLRFGLALRRHDLVAASAEVRHLADLIATQGTLISTAIAVAIYKLDARARELAAAAGNDVSGWPLTDGAQLQRYRQMTFASLYFTYPGVPEATLRKAAACFSSPCAALAEGAAANRSFGAIASHSNLALVEELFAANRCEPAVLARLARSRPLPAGEALNDLAEALDQELPKQFTPQ